VKWLDRIPLSFLVLVSVLMALAPFVPEPHVWQKLKMLFAGTLTRPVDLFDLVWHGAPAVVLVMKLARIARARRQGGAGR
jgi:hypothetical protein